MRLGLRRFGRCVRGSSAVEFAIVATPFFLLMFGVIEFGRLMWIREALAETAIAGARCAGIGQTQCASSGTYNQGLTLSFIQGTAKDWMISLASNDITIDSDATCSGVSGFIRVTIAYDFQTVAPKLLTALAGGTELSSSACFPKGTT